MNIGLVFNFCSLSSVAFGFIPELVFLGKIEKNMNLITNRNAIAGHDTTTDNATNTGADCNYNESPPYEEEKMKMVARLKRMVRCRRGQEQKSNKIEKLVVTENAKNHEPNEKKNLLETIINAALNKLRKKHVHS